MLKKTARNFVLSVILRNFAAVFGDSIPQIDIKKG